MDHRELHKPSYIDEDEVGYAVVINSPKSQWLNKAKVISHLHYTFNIEWWEALLT